MQVALHSNKEFKQLYFTCLKNYGTKLSQEKQCSQHCIWKVKKGCSDSTISVMSSFARNNKWHQQFTVLKSVYPKTLHLLFKDEYCRWSVVRIKRPCLLQGILTAPCSRGARLIRETFCQSAVLKVFLCYFYCLIETITFDHSTWLDADLSVLSKPSIFLLIFHQLQFYSF